MYQGLLAEQVFNQLYRCDPHLYTAGDFADFAPNPSEVRSTRFMHATVTAHGSNSPWKELFLLLKIYQLSAQDTTLLTPAQLCTAAGLIDTWLASQPASDTGNERTLDQQAALIHQQLKQDDPDRYHQLDLLPP